MKTHIKRKSLKSTFDGVDNCKVCMEDCHSYLMQISYTEKDMSKFLRLGTYLFFPTPRESDQ